ncbi:hypothetical protein MSPGM_43140 [Methylorubrum sp. GM97]|nr:hypothetical protein MSPGM_43140 [Methylorubrum sp. GM97]
MGRAEGVVLALRALGEAGEATALAQRADAVAAAGQDLVRVALVSDVPDDAVVGGVEDVVERHREFDHAQARAEMAAGDRHGVDHLGAHGVGHPLQLALRQKPETIRRLKTLKDRRVR